MSPSLLAEFSDGPVDCGHLNDGQEMYGCVSSHENVSNDKYKCLEALNAFEVPKKEDFNSDDFSKPGKTVKGDKLVACGKPNGDIKLSDGEKNYKIDKSKLLDAIRAKFSSAATQKEKYKVVLQTPEGKIKLKFKKKSGGEGGFDLGGWEKEPMQAGEELADDDVFMALGSQDEDNASENISSALNDKVQNFDSKVDEKVSEIESAAQEKIRETRRNRNLTSSDKRRIISQINNEKEEKKNFWNQKKAHKEQMKNVARVKCQGQPNLISENILGGNPSGGGGSEHQRVPASATNR